MFFPACLSRGRREGRPRTEQRGRGRGQPAGAGCLCPAGGSEPGVVFPGEKSPAELPGRCPLRRLAVGSYSSEGAQRRGGESGAPRGAAWQKPPRAGESGVPDGGQGWGALVVAGERPPGRGEVCWGHRYCGTSRDRVGRGVRISRGAKRRSSPKILVSAICKRPVRAGDRYPAQCSASTFWSAVQFGGLRKRIETGRVCRQLQRGHGGASVQPSRGGRQGVPHCTGRHLTLVSWFHQEDDCQG